MQQKQEIEINSMNELEKVHDKIINLLAEHKLSIPTSIGILELCKNEIMNQFPADYDDDFDDDGDDVIR